MALDASNVEVAVTGAVYLAPLGTTLPTDSDTPLDGAFQNVGYLSEDGITETPEEDTTEIQAWQNGDIVRRVLTSHEIQYAVHDDRDERALPQGVLRQLQRRERPDHRSAAAPPVHGDRDDR
jgi:hypothetical protein